MKPKSWSMNGFQFFAEFMGPKVLKPLSNVKKIKEK